MTYRDPKIILTFFGGNVSYRVGNGPEIYLEGLPKTEYNLLLGLAKLTDWWILPYDDAYKIVYDGEENLSRDRCPDNLAQVISRTRRKFNSHGKKIIRTVHTRGLRRGFKPKFID